MGRFILIILTAISISSCSTFRGLRVHDIESIRLELQPHANINYGFNFRGKIVAKLKSGEQIDITNHRRTTFRSADITKIKRRYTFAVNKPYMANYDDDSLNFSITYQRGKKMVNVNGSVYPNYGGGYRLIDHKYRFASVQSTSKDDYEVMIWKEEGLYYIYHAKRDWRYKTRGTAPFVFDLKGSKGMKGDDGHRGKDGSPGRERWLFKSLGPVAPEDGEAGEKGETGGQGGAGGNLKLIIHPNAKDIVNNIRINVSGGDGGDGGKGGVGGDGGEPLEGQCAGRSGPDGEWGDQGPKGDDGNSSVEIMEFDIQAIHEN